MTGEPPDANVTVGVEILLLAVNVNVTLSPALARVAVVLSDAIETPLKAGAVVSVAALPLPLVAAVPALPVVSVKAMLYVTAPSVSLAFAV